MPTYAWTGRSSGGELLRGSLEAEGEDAAAMQLMARGLVPVSIKPAAAKAATAQSFWQRMQARPITMQDNLMLTRQLYTLQKAGVPIMRSLAGLQASTPQPAIAAMLQDLSVSLDQGRDLGNAMSRHPKVFSAFYIAMIRIGELTGHLTEVFLRLSQYLEFEIDTKARIKQALNYPMMVVIAMGIALVVVNIFVLPTFAGVFAGFKVELPLATRMLLGFSAWMLYWWPLLIGLLVVAVVAMRRVLATPAGRYSWDRIKLRLPIAGPIILKATLSRFARSFALASSSGVPISQAMTVVAQTVDNTFIGGRIEQMRDGIERGESISSCAAGIGVFTPIVLQMIAVGEETGELDNLMGEIAQMYERETDYNIKGLSAAIEPILLLVIGGMVMVLALGIFLPLWNLGQAAGGKGG